MGSSASSVTPPSSPDGQQQREWLPPGTPGNAVSHSAVSASAAFSSHRRPNQQGGKQQVHYNNHHLQQQQQQQQHQQIAINRVSKSPEDSNLSILNVQAAYRKRMDKRSSQMSLVGTGSGNKRPRCWDNSISNPRRGLKNVN
ncbi:hypothetical protein PoB_001837100 [Plakobranchus ocellatus]|uniref:Uncharacterized protein n=1 Tax=Plakobranchus ocellatus TaxID=259542 RepID=A0AAV3YXN3_9GAST|nr:hypothetical protein PoB_001837100 [Plakobranchus ocellatus]